MEIFKSMGEYDYEQLVFMQDEETGLKAITCIHDTTLGPSLGGTRYWTYEKEEDAIEDAMRLARGMTYKAAASGLPLGGGKTVIIKDPANQVSQEALFRAFGRFVEGLNGRYITAADVGTTTVEMDYIYQETNYVAGTGLKPGTSGNPSPSTAHGVYVGMKAAAKKAFGTDSLEGKTIIIEGVGKVGYLLAEAALEEGAKVCATDLFNGPIERARDLGCDIVDANEMFEMQADIYAPCALGASINDDSLEKIKKAGIKVIAGAANNQLAEPRHGDKLEEMGLVYAPDYILNAGGLIQVADEFNGGYNAARARMSVDRIYDQIEKVFKIAERDGIPTYKAADALAEERIKAIRNTRSIFTQNGKSIINR
ncbi:leucine dehydrogenase [Alkalibacterium putridalgicola]|uniref:Leucine dehydrogenase n=1 Tax=Alkalibacterium putridalgicola TaxID=426703 RepID=A0A1H7VKQ7_9LACT|nr:Glu/Leu/Phe/Val dehydrogenase dimerization domain-containing protein [Alkalibacterium putridalgicola]GEK89400.1 leucine dehydrogenase [Alkalibacterium putridalgicola]SEM09398.1 leucine dehydrogenase [Alkalibacterium putridalgicola]